MGASRRHTLAAIIGYLVLALAASDARGAYGANRASCEVTKPEVATAPGVGEGDWITQEGLFVSFGEKTTVAGLPSDEHHAPPGTIFGHIGRNGSIGVKVPWFRESSAYGTLGVKGTRRPGGDRLRDRYSNHLGPESEVVPVASCFPARAAGTSPQHPERRS